MSCATREMEMAISHGGGLTQSDRKSAYVKCRSAVEDSTHVDMLL